MRLKLTTYLEGKLWWYTNGLVDKEEDGNSLRDGIYAEVMGKVVN